MSAEPAAAAAATAATAAAGKKRKTAGDSVKRTTPEDDHRRKRRNRTTQSCLNCHTSKRMCDRKRPCGRCTQLGLTGLCVYEVDDPSRNSDSQDEKVRLQQRVAELESVVRELKNKPHPRWVAGMDTSDKADKHAVNQTLTPPSSSNTSPSPSSPICAHKAPLSAIDTSGALLRAPVASMHGSPYMDPALPHIPQSPSIADSSPVDTPSPPAMSAIEPQMQAGDMQPDYDFSILPAYQSERVDDGLFRDIWDRFLRPDGGCGARASDHCGCLHDPANYNVVLELSLRLRKAADILSRSLKHGSGSGCCAITQNIAELDRFAS
ncbi:hypothetical protein WOLCODRAFT_90423 [Wolfiporia cocos MD-104 SS10]|uniref:Zn(2)-C6 fungal-type domain-containing protein n=1 Tax=Wolfiporia cocos (strain MD-104) TaxID=742152 RepID=A0A2H3JN97_WOLCO|nr:hypothetical protein WOLCODRAFT_90423 [Wolfiporia cocos MD-104 SS10]